MFLEIKSQTFFFISRKFLEFFQKSQIISRKNLGTNFQVWSCIDLFNDCAWASLSGKTFCSNLNYCFFFCRARRSAPRAPDARAHACAHKTPYILPCKFFYARMRARAHKTPCILYNVKHSAHKCARAHSQNLAPRAPPKKKTIKFKLSIFRRNRQSL